MIVAAVSRSAGAFGQDIYQIRFMTTASSTTRPNSRDTSRTR